MLFSQLTVQSERSLACQTFKGIAVLRKRVWVTIIADEGDADSGYAHCYAGADSAERSDVRGPDDTKRYDFFIWVEGGAAQCASAWRIWQAAGEEICCSQNVVISELDLSLWAELRNLSVYRFLLRWPTRWHLLIWMLGARCRLCLWRSALPTMSLSFEIRRRDGTVSPWGVHCSACSVIGAIILKQW